MKEEKKKLWIKRHPIWSIIIGIFLFFIIIGIFSGKDESKNTNQVNNIQNNPSTNINVEKIYKIDDRIVADKVAYTINKVDKLDFFGNEFLNKQPAGIFYIITLTVENTDTKSKDYFYPDFKIIDSKNREFSEDRDANVYMTTNNYNSFIFEQLQPSLSKQGSVAFDLPKDAKGLKLKIRGGLLSTEELTVDLGI